MELVVKRSVLLTEIMAAERVVERKSTIPILSNMLFSATAEGVLNITATDLDLSLRTSCLVAVKKPGSVCVPARKLYDYIKLLPECEITIKTLENNWLQIRAGRSHTKMVGMAPTNFPQLPAFPAADIAKLPATALKMLIDKTIIAVSKEESRYTLNGALMILTPESLTMVATDGHRLAYVKANGAMEGAGDGRRVLIPLKALGEVQSLIGNNNEGTFEFAADDSTLFFRFGTRVLTSRKLTGQFPNFEAVLPQKANVKVSAQVQRTELESAIRRVAQFADERSQAIRMRLEKNELKLMSTSSDHGDSEESLTVAYDDPKPFTIAFNASYITDLLKTVGGADMVSMNFSDPAAAGEFRPGNQPPESVDAHRYVVMPIRV